MTIQKQNKADTTNLINPDKNKAIVIICILLVLACGVFLRISMVMNTKMVRPLRKDAMDYYRYAYNLKFHGTFSSQWLKPETRPGEITPDKRRPPGYPLFLTAFIEYPPTAKMISAITMTQAILSILTILVSFSFFRSFLSLPWAIAAASLVTLSPHLIVMNIYILTESLFTFFLMLFALLMKRVIVSSTMVWGGLSGVTLGIGLLVRPTMLYFPVLLLPVFFIFFSRRKSSLLAVSLLLGLLLIYSPWPIRNILSVKQGQNTSLALDTIHKGMYPWLMYKDDPATYGFPNLADPRWNAHRTMLSVLSEIKRRFIREPFKYMLWYAVGKPLSFLSWGMIIGKGDAYVYPLVTSPYDFSIVFKITHRLMYWVHWPVIVLALFACIAVWSASIQKLLSNDALRVARFCMLVLLYFTAVHTVGTPLPRYAIPIKPLIYGMGMLGGYLVTMGVSRLLGRHMNFKRGLTAAVKTKNYKKNQRRD